MTGIHLSFNIIILQTLEKKKNDPTYFSPYMSNA